MRIVVTGGTGFIGSNLLPALVQQGHQPIAIVRKVPEVDPDFAGIEWVVGDLGSRDWDPANDLPDAVDAVLHLAQAKSYRDFPEQAPDIFEVNTAATLKMLNYARRAGASHFIYASSGSVYTGINEPLLSEDLPISPSNFSEHPLGFYCATKLCGEALVESFRTQISSVVSLRIFSPYGPGGDASLINRLVGRVTAGETIQIQGNPGMTFNPIYISDLLRIIVRLLQGSSDGASGPLNLAGPEPVSLSDIIQITGELSGVAPELIYLPSEPPAGPRLVADISRTMRLLGDVESLTMMREGIQKLLDWERRE